MIRPDIGSQKGKFLRMKQMATTRMNKAFLRLLHNLRRRIFQDERTIRQVEGVARRIEAAQDPTFTQN